MAIVFSWWSSKSALIHCRNILHFFLRIRDAGKIRFAFDGQYCVFFLLSPTHPHTNTRSRTYRMVCVCTHVIHTHPHTLAHAVDNTMGIHSHIKCYCRSVAIKWQTMHTYWLLLNLWLFFFCSFRFFTFYLEFVFCVWWWLCLSACV
jgi:hypothetical protein